MQIKFIVRLERFPTFLAYKRLGYSYAGISYIAAVRSGTDAGC